MKSRLGKLIISALLFFVCAILQNSFISCTKTNTVTVTNTVTDTFTVTKNDTLVKSDTTLTVAILTANSWKLAFDRAVVGLDTFYYVRGGTANSIDYDNEYITFNTNGTGLYTHNDGSQDTFTWSFADTTNTIINWLDNSAIPTNETWENIYYKNGALHYDEYSDRTNGNELSAQIRIPK